MIHKYDLFCTLSTLVAAAAFCISCAETIAPPVDEPTLSVINASIEQTREESETKAVMGVYEEGKGYPIVWSKNDKIAVDSPGRASSPFFCEYVYNGEDGKQSGEFYYTGSQVSGVAYAYYPYDETTMSKNGSIFNVIVPRVQYYRDGSFGKGAMPMYAKTNDINKNGLNFKPLMSVLRIQLSGSGVSVRRIYLSAKTHSTLLCGRATVDMSQDTPELVFSEGMDYVELWCAEAVPLNETPKSFFIIVPQNTVPTDYNVKVVTTDNQVMNKSLRSKTFTKGVIKKLKSASFSETTDFSYSEGTYNGKGVKINGVIWAPVNCGQREITSTGGLFYQWGRKYGQASTGSIDLYDQVTNMADGNVAEMADHFIGGDKVYSWFSNTSIKDYWWSNYDPCPDGWRVPDYDERSWLGERIVGNGVFRTDLGGNITFPKMGGRSAIDGHFFFSSSGCYWSAQSYHLNKSFGEGIAFSSSFAFNYYNRGDAMSVRCVQE